MGIRIIDTLKITVISTSTVAASQRTKSETSSLTEPAPVLVYHDLR